MIPPRSFLPEGSAFVAFVAVAAIAINAFAATSVHAGTFTWVGGSATALNGGAVVVTPDGMDANVESVEARDNTAISAAAHRFLKMEIERP